MTNVLNIEDYRQKEEIRIDPPEEPVMTEDEKVLQSASRQLTTTGWAISDLMEIKTEVLARLRFGHGADITNAAGEIKYMIEFLTSKLAELERLND